jgi:hypothetical protein
MHGGSWEDKTAPNAPLKAHPTETGNQTTLNVVSCLSVSLKDHSYV